MRNGCIMSPWLINVYMDGVMKGDGGEDGKEKEGSEFCGGWESGDCLTSCMQMT